MKKVIVIAEAGVNHNGDLERAKRLIDVAAEAGADFVKFQSFKANKLVSKHALKADYQKKNTPGEESDQFTMLKKLELSHEDHLDLMDYCMKCNIKFLSTAFDIDGVSYLNDLGLELFKIPSGEITNYPYLRKIAEMGKPVVLSTGMADLVEIEGALTLLTSGSLGKEDITILHCNTEYPTPMGDVNLKAMNAIGKALDVNIGYSDHTLGIEVPTAAVAMGATVIEKHFTLDRNLPGPDHRASLEPDELIGMMNAIRNIEQALSGNGKKEPSQSETKNKPIARKSIHLATDIAEGMVIEDKHLIPLRPGSGISPMKWLEVVGKQATRDLKNGELLNPGDFA